VRSRTHTTSRTQLTLTVTVTLEQSHAEMIEEGRARGHPRGETKVPSRDERQLVKRLRETESTFARE